MALQSFRFSSGKTLNNMFWSITANSARLVDDSEASDLLYLDDLHCDWGSERGGKKRHIPRHDESEREWKSRLFCGAWRDSLRFTTSARERLLPFFLYSSFFLFWLVEEKREVGKKITQSTGIHSFAYNDYSSRASNSKHSTLNDNNQILQWMNSHWRCACKTERVGFSSFTKNFFFHFVFFCIFILLLNRGGLCWAREREHRICQT